MVTVKITNNIANKISQFQKKYGSSRTFIAERIGMSRQSLNAIERSDNPTVTMLERIAYVLECDIKELYEATITETD